MKNERKTRKRKDIADSLNNMLEETRKTGQRLILFGSIVLLVCQYIAIKQISKKEVQDVCERSNIRRWMLVTMIWNCLSQVGLQIWVLKPKLIWKGKDGQGNLVLDIGITAVQMRGLLLVGSVWVALCIWGYIEKRSSPCA